MLLDNKQIAIVGGGPGGLTLAKLLQLKGANVKVYERDINRQVRVQGATLDLHEESGLEALRRAGLIEAFKQSYRPDAGRMRITDKHAFIQLDDHLSGGSFTEDRPEIDRGPLRKILLDSLESDTIVWDSHFVCMEREGSGWMLHFKNGTSVYADILIAADGANSKIRSYITGIQPIYSGITIVEGNVYDAEKNAPKLNELVKGGKVFALGDEQSLILNSKGDGSISFYTGCKVPEQWVKESSIDFNDKVQVHEWFKKAFTNWDEIWQELFANDEMYCIPRPQYHYPLDQHWQTLSNLTMLGDAAHLMPPYAGEGVNMAMQDAYELAECLTSDRYANIHTALEAYETVMLKRAAAITQVTLDSTAMLHGGNAINDFIVMMNGDNNPDA